MSFFQSRKKSCPNARHLLPRLSCSVSSCGQAEEPSSFLRLSLFRSKQIQLIFSKTNNTFLQDVLGGEYGARCGMSKSSNMPQQIHYLGAALQVYILPFYQVLPGLVCSSYNRQECRLGVWLAAARS